MVIIEVIDELRLELERDERDERLSIIEH